MTGLCVPARAGITFSGEMGDVVPDLEEMVETGRVAIDFPRQAARFEYIQPQIVDVAVQDVHARTLRRHRMVFPGFEVAI